MKKFGIVLLVALAFVLTACAGNNFADMTEDQKANEIVQAYVAYMSTVEGKAIIAAEGGIVETSSSDPNWADIAEDYPIVDEDNSEVTVKFGGSTSVEGVARALSASFSSLAGDFIPEHNHTGSGDGYKRVQGEEKDGASKAHIGFASRDFKDTEQGAAGTYGRLAWDAVVVVVDDTNNSLTNITAAQTKAVYDGTTTDWSALGTGSGSINVYTRDTTSGTREAFFKGIDFGDAVDTNAVLVTGFSEVSGNGTMMSSVAADASGIGYISLSSLDSSLNGLNFEGVEPTEANVLNDTYGLKRPFMYMTRDYETENADDANVDAAIVEKFELF